MLFEQIYGEAISHELGSEDTVRLFTTTRRQNAVNRAQKEFARLTRLSLQRELTTAVTTGVTSYNLDTLSSSRFVNFTKTQPRLAVTTIATGAIAYTELAVRSVVWMDENAPGWRDTATEGVPDTLVHDGANGVNVGLLTPEPNVPATETWQLVVPYQANAADMADGQTPFDGRPDLEPYHWALAHFAAAILERLRKDADAEKAQIAKFGAYVQDWNEQRGRKGAKRRVTQQRDYLGEVSRGKGRLILQGDPRR